MSRKVKLLSLFIFLIFSIPYIKSLMIYIAILNLYSIDFIKNLLLKVFHYFSFATPNVILMIIAQIFWPLLITYCLDRCSQWRKRKLIIHPVAFATGLWIILNGSVLLIQ